MKNEIKGLTAILDAMEDGMYIISQDYTIDFMNKSMVRDFGMGIGEKCYQVINHSDTICSQCHVSEVFEKGETLRWEKYVPHLKKTYEITEMPVKNEDGSLSKLTKYRDITHRKINEEKVKAYKEDYKRLFEHVGCGVYISTKEGRFLDANQALLDMLRYKSKEEFLKIDITKDLYLTPDDHRRFRELIERDGRVIDYEVDFKRKDGKPISVLLTGHVRYDQQGNVLGYEGLNVDQTQRKRMERELKEAHDFLNKIIQSSPNAIIVADLKGKIIVWNRAAEEILGYQAQNTVNKMNIEDIYPEGMATKIIEMMHSPEYGGKGRLRSYPLSYERHDGEIVEGSLSATIIYDTKGNELAFVNIFVDLKERLDMERKLRQTQEQLLQSEKLVSIGRLSAGVAHEINNPLTTILTSSMLIQEDMDAGDHIYRELKTISDEALRCRKIVTSLLDFARQTKPTKQLNDLNEIVRQSFVLTRKQAAFQDVSVELNLSENLPDICLDKDQIQQALINLTLNAIEATDPGGRIDLTTLFDSKTDTVEISVRDTGIGIQPENLDKIFDPFFTTTEGGTGLGLAVTHGIIEQHGGTINVESKPGQGTCVTIRLPRELG
jgi:two-component system NtrC family sensor kinase